ncbi:uncharacterized protein TrAtP1_001544 [Trichoderma atroviride]|uniref:uncharacterized protein n=1 Tax=Hypocrea atroviridis TaxID=63577 RepID=UPI0033201800|nr:hypothetical protein TrAtP1_001544 [Trichoderma atroviride]
MYLYAGSLVFSSRPARLPQLPTVASTSAALAVHADEVVLGTTRSETSTFLEMPSLAIGYCVSRIGIHMICYQQVARHPAAVERDDRHASKWIGQAGPGMHGTQSGPVRTAASSPHPRPNRGDAIILFILICRLPGVLPRYRLRVLSQTVGFPLPQYGYQDGGKRSGF